MRPTPRGHFHNGFILDSYAVNMTGDNAHIAGEPEGHSVNDAQRWSRPTKPVAWFVLPMALAIPFLSAALWAINVVTGSPAPHGLWHQAWTAFDIGIEGNVSVWYAASLWLLLGLVATLAALLAPRHRPSWWLFAVVCTVAAADEAAALHERLIFVGDRLRPHLPFDLFYSWVVPGAIIALVVAASLARLVLALRVRVTTTLVLAGVLFLTGALVIESITGMLHLEAGLITPQYVLLMYVEETLELVGVSLALVGMASMFVLRRIAGAVSVAFDGYRPREASTSGA